MHDQQPAESSEPEQVAGETETSVEDDVPAINTMELDVEHAHVDHHRVANEPAVARRAEPEPEPEPEAAAEPEPEPEEEEAEPAPPPARPAPARAQKPAPRPVAKAPEPEPEPEPEQEPVEEPEEVEEVEERAAARSKPKAVPQLRLTRPSKPKKGKTPVREEQPPQRQPVNPFMRQRQKPKSPSPKAGQRVATPPAEVPRAAAPKENTAERTPDSNFVDLADWLREDRGPRSYRMIAEEDHDRDEGEQADFTDMLEKFKAGVAANVDDEDFDSHYDLGVAYKEMGLIDEAIAEFQKALRGATQRIRAYEALGQCFIDRNDFDTAITVLGRALREPGMEDEDLIGVLYLLGFASEGSKKPRDAAAYYQRVFAIDIDFRDVSKRLKQMTKAASK
jgi:hypothetical protein